MPPTERVISSYEVEMIVISLGAGHQRANRWLLIYINTPQAKGKGSGLGDGHAFLPGAMPVSRR
jgi:hypothetical protein